MIVILMSSLEEAIKKGLAATYFPVPRSGTVSSALGGLTAGFGMEPGVSPPLWPPALLLLSGN
jgi:hypothetical protein